MARLAFLFLEPSTRTYASYWMAARKLGIEIMDVRESSMVKGESLEDTVYTLELLGFDGIVLRTPWDDGLARAEAAVSIDIVDAGQGTKSHPSQAVGDLRTMAELGLYPVTTPVAFLGDVANSRVFSSLAPNLGNWNAFNDADEAYNWGAAVYYCLRPQRERGFEGDNHSSMVLPRHMQDGQFIFCAGPYTGEEFDRTLLKHPHNKMASQVKNGFEIRKLILSRWGHLV